MFFTGVYLISITNIHHSYTLLTALSNYEAILHDAFDLKHIRFLKQREMLSPNKMDLTLPYLHFQILQASRFKVSLR